MLITSVILFAAAALVGIALAFIRAKTEANPPLPLALLHGPLAVAGYLVLLVFTVQNGFPLLPTLAVGLLTAAALSGLYLIATHLRTRIISFSLIIGHAFFAVSGVVVLLFTLLVGTP